MGLTTAGALVRTHWRCLVGDGLGTNLRTDLLASFVPPAERISSGLNPPPLLENPERFYRSGW